MPSPVVAVQYAVTPRFEDWVLPEGTVPESTSHADAAAHLEEVLKNWAKRTPRNVEIVRNLAMRWSQERPRIGIDPDVAVLEPAPPEGREELMSLRLWCEGHHPPPVCFEVVSKNHPHKDYAAVQDRYAALGAFELIVFDPHGFGPKRLGGPFLLQLWRRTEEGAFVRLHAGGSPVYSMALQAWAHADSNLLQLSGDELGKERWLTAAQQNEKRAQQSEDRIAELERQLAELKARR